MLQRLRERNEWKFFGVLPKADRAPGDRRGGSCSCCGACCPRCFADRHGRAWSARCSAGDDLTAPLALVGVVFVLLQVLTRRSTRRSAPTSAAAPRPGSTTGSPRACVRPPGMGHLEDPSSPTTSRWRATSTSASPARRCRSRWTSSPAGLVELVGGLASAVVLAGFAWWAPLLLAGAWLATHWLLRESAVWRDRNTDEVREAQRHADYAYRLAVDPPAAKELRLFGLADWTVERFVARAARLLRAAVARRPGCASGRWSWSLLLVLAANVVVFWALAERRRRRQPRPRPRGRRSRRPRSAPA